jgi:uncharacterized protein (DUF362 family)
MTAKPRVSIVRCDASSDDDHVMDSVARSLDLLGDTMETFRGLKTIFVKTNIGLKEIKLHAGRQVALPDACVLRAVVRALRQHSDAEILVGDTATEKGTTTEIYEVMGYPEALAEFDVELIDTEDEPLVEAPVPGGGLMFDRYWISKRVADADAIVSVQKMKAHMAAGTTLTMKNLFGLTSLAKYGKPRRYLHAHVRLPHTIADMGLLFKPTLNVIDGLVAMNHKEWYGPALKTDVIVAGDNTVATDAVGTHLMGFDPAGVHPEPPYVFDRNPLLLASDAGLGPIDLADIELLGDELQKVGDFEVQANISPEDNAEVHRTLAEQVALYRGDQGNYVDQYEGQYIGLSGGDVMYQGTDLQNLKSRREIARESGKANQGLFLKYVEPEGVDPEHLGVYDSYGVGAVGG